jgi:hypothetical protein
VPNDPDDGGGGREDNGMPEEDNRDWVVRAVIGVLVGLVAIIAVILCGVITYVYRKRKQTHNKGTFYVYDKIH